MKKMLFATLCALALAVPATAQSIPGGPGEPGYFVVDVRGEQFVVLINDPAAAAKARDILAGRAPQQIVVADLKYGNGGFNFDGNICYSWHLDPDDVTFAEFTVELCDGRPYSDVERDVTYWVDHVGYYCPWSGVLVAEIEKPKHPDCRISK